MTSFLRPLAYRYRWIYDAVTAISSLSVGGVWTVCGGWVWMRWVIASHPQPRCLISAAGVAKRLLHGLQQGST